MWLVRSGGLVELDSRVAGCGRVRGLGSRPFLHFDALGIWVVAAQMVAILPLGREGG